MKPATVAALCALSAALAAGAGAYGGMAFDRHTGDLNGANARMNEVATQLKVMAGLLIQLRQEDPGRMRNVVEESMRASKAAIEKGRASPGLSPSTLMRMDEAVNLAAAAEKP